MQDYGFYNKAQVLDLTTFSQATLWRRIKAGEFPEPVKLSPGRVAWYRQDIHVWLEAVRGADHAV